MKKVTYAEFMTFNPCWEAKDVKAIFDQHDGAMTALDILHREDISADDKQWAVLRKDFIPAPILHKFDCICTEYALSLADNPNTRRVNAITVKRKWIKWAATAMAAARAAARDAARAAAWDAAWNAAWAAQCAVLEMMITEDTP